MKVIKKEEIGNKELNLIYNKHKADIIISGFNYAMNEGVFHYNSTEKQKVILFPAEADYINDYSTKLAIDEIKKAGWDAEFKVSTCAHGWFNSIIVNL